MEKPSPLRSKPSGNGFFAFLNQFLPKWWKASESVDNKKPTTEEVEAESDYYRVGWYHVTEVKPLFESLESEGVRFYFETKESGISQMDTATASLGGSFGQGAQVLVFVHNEDQAAFEHVHKDLLSSLDVEKIDWKKNLRGGYQE